MKRRLFLQTVALGASGLVFGRAAAGPLPVSPVFGRSFDNLDGRPVDLSGYVGRPVLMNFWASWCAPCVREMPLLEELHHENPDLVMLGLAVDTKANVQRFLEKVHVSYQLLLTGTQGISLMRELGNKAGGLPYTVLFNRQGRMHEQIIGELEPDDIRSRVTNIL